MRLFTDCNKINFKFKLVFYCRMLTIGKYRNKFASEINNTISQTNNY